MRDDKYFLSYKTYLYNFFNSRLPLSEVQDKGADVGFVA